MSEYDAESDATQFLTWLSSDEARVVVAWETHRTWCSVKTCAPELLEEGDLEIAGAALAVVRREFGRANV